MRAFRVAHSHITPTRQLADSSDARVRASRSTFTRNLVCQNSELVDGVVASLHPS